MLSLHRPPTWTFGRFAAGSPRPILFEVGSVLRVRVSAIAAVVATILMLPTPAAATDYCVAPNTTCGGTNVANFQTALANAAGVSNADRIFLGATTYTAPTTAGYSYSAPGSPVEIIGAGIGQTTLTAPSTASGVLYLDGGSSSSIHGLSIHVPTNFAVSSGGLTTFSLAHDLVVDASATQSNSFWGIGINNAGSVTDTTVMLPTSPSGPVISGVLIMGSSTDPVPLTRDNITARTAVNMNAGLAGTTLDRLELSGQTGVSVAGRTVNVHSTLIHLTENQGTGLFAIDQPSSNAVLNADGVTVIDEGVTSTQGASADSINSSPRSATLNLTNSVLRGVDSSLNRFASSTGTANIAATYSDYDPSITAATGPGTTTPPPGMLDPGANLNVDPLFLGGADFHLMPSSPLVDRGDPATTGALDLDGNARVTDGNGDGVARVDIGAYEVAGVPAPPATPAPDKTASDVQNLRFQRRVFAAFGSGPSVIASARKKKTPKGSRVSYTLAEDATVKFKVERATKGRRKGKKCVAKRKKGKRCTIYKRIKGSFTHAGRKGSNSFRFSGRVGGKKLRPARYRLAAVATDTAGNRGKAVRRSFRIKH
jgi:hypothetical protein